MVEQNKKGERGPVQPIEELEKIARDANVSHRDRITALNTIARLNRQAEQAGGGALLELSREDIHAEIARVQGALAGQVIDFSTPATPLTREQPTPKKRRAPAKTGTRVKKVKLVPGKDRGG